MRVVVIQACRLATGALACALLLGNIGFAHAQGRTLIVGEPIRLLGTDSTVMSAVAEDMNGDQLPDVVVGTNSSSPFLFLNNGTAAPFAGVVPQRLSQTDQQQQAYVVDANRDGRPDIIGVGFNVPTRLYLNNGTADPFAGVMSSPVNTGSVDSSTALAVGDVNGDTLPDLALSNTNHYANKLILNNGTANPFGTSPPLAIGAEEAYSYDIALADVNADGRPDAILSFALIMQGEPAGVYIYLNNGSNDPFNAVSPIILLGGQGASKVKVADLNRDDRPDLVVTGANIGNNVVFLHSGSTTDPYPQSLSLPASDVDSSCFSLAVFDIDADGFADVALGCGVSYPDRTSAPIGAIYLNNGTADPFGAVAPVHVPLHQFADFSRSAQVVDFTRSGSLSLLLGDAYATFFPLHMDQNPVAHDDSFATSGSQFIDADVLANDTDADGTLDRPTLEITVTPLHGITRIDAGSQRIIYQPDPGFTGTDSFRYTVRDEHGALSNAGTVSLRVQGVPVGNSDVASTTANRQVSINVLSNDTSPGGTLDASSLTIADVPAHGTATVVAGSSSISYQPASGFAGIDVFQYTVRDNLGTVSNVTTVTVTVTSPPPAQGGGGGGGGGALNLLLLAVIGTLSLARYDRRRGDRKRRQLVSSVRGITMKMVQMAAVAASAILLSACATTNQVADTQFRPPEGHYRVIVMQPDISVGVLTAGGAVEPREDWTNQARDNVLKALSAQQTKRGGDIKIASTREEAGGDTQQVSDLIWLHNAVGQAIKVHKYTVFTLPTKQGKFDWTLGKEAVAFGQATQYDYALFLHAQDSFSSGGRVALQAMSMLGCAVGVCVMPAGGMQIAFASLVDLKSGQVVWFNTLASGSGDIRTPQGAQQMVDSLLDKMESGKVPKQKKKA